MKKLPLTILLVFVGIIISNFGGDIILFESLRGFKLTPELVLFVFIPALIFESTYNLDVKERTKKGDSLSLIARGIAKVERTQNGYMERLATLCAGVFFGEGALLIGGAKKC